MNPRARHSRSSRPRTQQRAPSSSKPHPHVLKVLFVGEGNSGKSSLLKAFLDGVPPATPAKTIGTTRSVTTLILGTRRIKFELWDTGGDLLGSGVLKLDIFRGVHCILICYSIDARDQFEHLAHWQLLAGTTPVILVANKADEDGVVRAISSEQGEQQAKAWSAPFFETSAKTGLNVSACLRTAGLLAASERGLLQDRTSIRRFLLKAPPVPSGASQSWTQARHSVAGRKVRAAVRCVLTLALVEPRTQLPRFPAAQFGKLPSTTLLEIFAYLPAAFDSDAPPFTFDVTTKMPQTGPARRPARYEYDGRRPEPEAPSGGSGTSRSLQSLGCCYFRTVPCEKHRTPGKGSGGASLRLACRWADTTTLARGYRSRSEPLSTEARAKRALSAHMVRLPSASLSEEQSDESEPRAQSDIFISPASLNFLKPHS